MSGRNKIFSRSGKSQGILKKCQGIWSIWPMLGNCQGILSCHVRELSENFVMAFFLDWNYYHIIRDLPGLCLCKCLLGKYKLKAYWLLLLSCCLWRYVVGLPLITIKRVLLTLKNKINYQGKMLFCQGNVREFWTDLNVATLAKRRQIVWWKLGHCISREHRCFNLRHYYVGSSTTVTEWNPRRNSSFIAHSLSN